MKYPVFTLDAGRYDELNTHTDLYNIHELGNQALIHFQDADARGFTLSTIEKLSNEDDSSPITSEDISRDNMCWYIVPVELLDTSIGHHVYRITMTEDNNSSSYYFLYIAYIIQRGDVEKPYVYMNRVTDDPEITPE